MCYSAPDRDAVTPKNQTGPGSTFTPIYKSINDTYVKKDFQVYDCMLEQDRSRLMMSELGNEISIQPQVHVGILPVQAKLPSSSTQNYICAAAYWQIDRSIKVKLILEQRLRM